MHREAIKLDSRAFSLLPIVHCVLIRLRLIVFKVSGKYKRQQFSKSCLGDTERTGKPPDAIVSPSVCS
jgi:hypothetical protein